MKNKKGFTLVELVIVIAVIAILAAVLLPTFGGIIANARTSSANSQAKGGLDNYYSSAYPGTAGEMMSMTDLEDISVVVNVNGKYYAYVLENGVLVNKLTATDDASEYTDGFELASFDNGKTHIYVDNMPTTLGNNVYLMENLMAQTTLGGDVYGKAVTAITPNVTYMTRS